MKLGIPSPIEHLAFDLFRKMRVTVDVKRDDLIHPIISGNKFRKLQGHLERYQQIQSSGVVSMGGPWSNHLHALAGLCNERNIPLLCLVRGPKPKHYSQMLDDIKDWDAQLLFLSRDEYRMLRQANVTDNLSKIDFLANYQNYYFIPEGGYGSDAMQGIATLARELPVTYDHIYLGVGTGTTMAGLLNVYSNNASHIATNITGVLALRAGNSQTETIQQLCTSENNNWQLCPDFIGKGFAKSSAELETFMWHMYESTGLITEPVYTAKTLYGLSQHIEASVIKAGQKVLFLHTGGLQGLRGYPSTICKKLAHAAGF